ncbi:hypothetical protein BS50DRAFT_569448 [Corynespora cassiicola Philippines]|uniref:Uncharacterized protein n=1 Tax=Corynespora cassiicola Philippines TaxID=1448308 RepID=A0A2T2P2E0_CORCC|nr:hypothetical protein BS50DRAFT_569448 [Corynespora cassiicola Philippines]
MSLSVSPGIVGGSPCVFVCDFWTPKSACDFCIFYLNSAIFGLSSSHAICLFNLKKG